MAEFSIQTLMIAISSTVAERSRVLARIAAVTPEIDEEEHLSERVMDIDRALGELGSAYESQRQGARRYPDYEALVASAEGR
ncbi:MAG: hypothetical protein JWO70_3536 [Betaproteobacteria bacterium]|nr:hypothetical protein [Betaproteobacteria bacterium]